MDLPAVGVNHLRGVDAFAAGILLFLKHGTAIVVIDPVGLNRQVDRRVQCKGQNHEETILAVRGSGTEE